MNDVAARAELQRMVRDADEPTLTSAEVDALLARARRPDHAGTDADPYLAWKSNAAYAVGAKLVPTVRNGHVYEITVSDGFSGATEPVWPTTSAGTVSLDGVTYREAGSVSWVSTWDLNAAAAEGWQQKAGKVAGQFTFSDDAGSYNRKEVFDMCERMAEVYRKKALGWLPISRAQLPSEWGSVIGNGPA